MDREGILREIRRTAEANGGKALGYRSFVAKTGIGDWWKHWPNWSDAVRDAGLQPNVPLEAFTDEYLIEQLIALARKLGHYPVWREWRVEKRSNPEFPGEQAIRKRLGTTAEAAQRVFDYCREHDGYDDVLPIVEPAIKIGATITGRTAPARGYVYLIKSGRTYKIGKAISVDQRSRQFSIQLPHPHVVVHKIETDDAAGIEAYWHRRFADKRQGTSEWFALTADDVNAFKRRQRFM